MDTKILKIDDPKEAYMIDAPPLIKSPEPEIKFTRERPTLLRKSQASKLDPKLLLRKFRESANSGLRDSFSQANP